MPGPVVGNKDGYLDVNVAVYGVRSSDSGDGSTSNNRGNGGGKLDGAFVKLVRVYLAADDGLQAGERSLPCCRALLREITDQ